MFSSLYYWVFFSDVDECLSDSCDRNAACINTAGSYSCECNTGFSGSGVTCDSKSALVV